MRRAAAFIVSLASVVSANERALDVWFTPLYTLPGQGAVVPGDRPVPPTSPETTFGYEPQPLTLFGSVATDRVTHLLDRADLPSGPFTVELWVLDHVNQPVGALLAAKGDGPRDDVAWAIGYHDGRAVYSVGGRTVTAATEEHAFKEYWHHIVGTFDGTSGALYLNGSRVEAFERSITEHGYGGAAQLELAAFTEHEPYMTLGNLVQNVRVHDRALSTEEIRERFVEIGTAVEEGVLFPGRFHFTTPPYLHMATRSGISVTCEADRPVTATIRYGRTQPMDQVETTSDARRLAEFRLEGLEPSTRYYYSITLTDEDGHTIESGTLSFKTAVREGEAISFAVIGDTEARPHVNDQVAQRVWEERPDFVINCGDLTDGGFEDRKFQWTHEYLLGIGHLFGRVPCFPVPGNGEGDLYWYRYYHALPESEAFYSFRYGNAEFFMLDSNQSAADFREGGRQYEWLRKKLEASTATWKFCAHHHPVYTSDENDYGNTWKGEENPLGDLRVRQIVSLYEEYGVDAVFFGHMHLYERSWPIANDAVDLTRGVVYFQTGGAGGNIEDFTPTREWFKNKSLKGHHYCMINIMDGVLEFRMYDTDGNLRDVTTMTK